MSSVPSPAPRSLLFEFLICSSRAKHTPEAAGRQRAVSSVWVRNDSYEASLERNKSRRSFRTKRRSVTAPCEPLTRAAGT